MASADDEARDGEQYRMIRREPPSTGAASEWILISQIDHAHLAGRLAEHWGCDGFASLAPREPVLWAIIHHDDGWREWEAWPGVDPISGRPQSFTEMAVGDSLEIWTRSINAASAAGPLEAYMVAGHFGALARRASAWKNDAPQWPAVERFLTRHDDLMAQWLAEWLAKDRSQHTAQMARRALEQLQFFDALSLWFCCWDARDAEQVQPPASPELTLFPKTPRQIGLAPWPLIVDRLNLEIPARAVPAVAYTSREELALAPSQPLQLRWELRPEPGLA